MRNETHCLDGLDCFTHVQHQPWVVATCEYVCIKSLVDWSTIYIILIKWRRLLCVIKSIYCVKTFLVARQERIKETHWIDWVIVTTFRMFRSFVSSQIDWIRFIVLESDHSIISGWGDLTSLDNLPDELFIIKGKLTFHMRFGIEQETHWIDSFRLRHGDVASVETSSQLITVVVWHTLKLWQW